MENSMKKSWKKEPISGRGAYTAAAVYLRTTFGKIFTRLHFSIAPTKAIQVSSFFSPLSAL